MKNLKTKLISTLYGVVCHVTFVISGLCMFWVLYNGFTVSLGSVRQPLSIIINIFLLLQFPILHSFLLTNSGRQFLRFFTPRNYAKTLEKDKFKNKDLKKISNKIFLSNNGEGIIINKDYTKGILLRGYSKTSFPKLDIVNNIGVQRPMIRSGNKFNKK